MDKEIKDYKKEKMTNTANTIREKNGHQKGGMSQNVMDLPLGYILGTRESYSQMLYHVFQKLGITEMTFEGISAEDFMKKPIKAGLTWGPKDGDIKNDMTIVVEYHLEEFEKENKDDEE